MQKDNAESSFYCLKSEEVLGVRIVSLHGNVSFICDMEGIELKMK